MSLRILLLPSVGSRSSWFVDSSFVVTFHWVKRWAGKAFVYYGFEFDLGEIPEEFQLPHVKFVSLNKPFQSLRQTQRSMDSDWVEFFDPLRGPMPADLILTTRTGCAGNIYLQFQYGSPASGFVPVLPVELMADGFFPESHITEEPERVASYLSRPTIVLTEAVRKGINKYLRPYLSSAQCAKVASSMKVQSQGIDFEKIDRVAEGVEKYETMTLLIACRFNQWKDPRATLKIFSHAFKIGLDVSIHALSSTTSNLFFELQAEFKEIEWIPRMAHEKYLEECAKCHIILVMSGREAFPVGYFEQIATGNPGVFARRDWGEEILGHDYPFFVNNEKEACACVKWIIRNYEEAREMMVPVVKRLRDRYDVRDCAEWYFNACVEAAENSSFPLTRREDDILALLKGAFPTDEFSLKDACALIYKEFNWTADPGLMGRGLPPICMRDIYVFLKGHFTDTLEEVPFFKGRIEDA